MKFQSSKSPLALAALAALGAAALSTVPFGASAAGKTAGHYVTGDFHNHTTCSDGTISMQKLVKKSTDKIDTPWGLDWFVQAGHGGNGNRNCTLAEDDTLSTPAFPVVSGQSPNTTWASSIGAAAIKGDGGGVGGNGNMWRWQTLQEFQYPLVEYLAAYKDLPLFMGLESVVPGHEHTSMSVIDGQMPASLDTVVLPTTPGYTPLGNDTALAKWSYCFDRGDTDTSRGNTTGTATGNNWDCSVTGSANSGDVSWNATAHKLIPASGAGVGIKGHLKTVEAMKWMAQNAVATSYYVPAHLERAGPFYADGNQGFNVEHLRDFNNAAPTVAFGMETQPGHGASANRGEYQVARNTINGVKVDSVGGTTWGGTGVYGGQVGGVWDAMLGEGRNFWYFASSDWHNRGIFGPDDRRTTQDFYPGEYARDFVMVRNGADKLRPQTIVDGLRTGNSFVANGQLIDRLAFVACASYAGPAARSNAQVEALAVGAATNNTDIDASNCATMGEKLVVRPGAEIVVSVVVRDPAGANYSPYTFSNPSLLQVGIDRPINMPMLDHVDLIRGMVSGYRTPGAADYSGAWPNTWLVNPDLATVPAAAKNTTTAVIRSFNGNGSSAWTPVTSSADGSAFLKMTYRIPAVTASQYVRLRGTNMPAAVPYETDASGNPLADVYTNASDTTRLRIPCNTVGTVLEGNAINGCPAHLPVVGGQKYVAFDVAAWSDLWFYSNPIFVQVNGSTTVAGVR